ncbi:hypothetical protein K503DRAFT_614396 [Rhizopogon vinicolor AM-OR11-026]|uniref:Uncharacterized protein n=1 Tax=Rhizopogon vinicolor AM-OR11-026 TaxID=1314800 RepID=A0A1B7N6H9_9AGAM|nr:hypothetical protein K503DRAFT_614396 [Rhizopogon vinicolor AM-OR11-026]
MSTPNSGPCAVFLLAPVLHSTVIGNERLVRHVLAPSRVKARQQSLESSLRQRAAPVPDTYPEKVVAQRSKRI